MCKRQGSVHTCRVVAMLEKKNEEKMSYLKNDRQKKNGRLTLHNHHPTLNESNRNRTVAQHGKDGWDECLGGWATTGLGMRCT